MRDVSLDGDSVFTLGSIGTERAMKVILGCQTVDKEGHWPSKSQLMSWGHDIEELNSTVMKAIDEGLAQTTANGYAAQLADHLRKDTVLPLLFATFARYGKAGRFHHLDILATDKPGALDQPSAYWDRIEKHVQITNPQFHHIPLDDNAAFEEYIHKLRGTIADHLESWWFCIHRLGVQGCFGDLGTKIGWEIWDGARATPAHLR